MTSPLPDLQHAAPRSLQRTEAEARAALLRVESCEVELDLASDVETFSSRTTLRFTSAGGATFVDLKPRRVRSLVLNGRPLDADALVGGRLGIDTVPGANELVVDAVMAFRTDGEGLHRSVDPADGRHYVYGMSFMDAAPSIFACFDQPDLKAPYTFTVRAPRDWVVLGNAPASNPEPGLWRIGPTPPLSTYFVTVVAGPYYLIRDEHDGIPLGLSARSSLAGALEADAEDLLGVTRASLDELHRLFGIRYAFGDYHQAFVPEFNAGAMENPGCVTLRDQMLSSTRLSRGARIVRATTIAHELAHQWFGNLVTPRWWDDLWLNESFAEYTGTRVVADATEYADAWVDNSYLRRCWGLGADLGPNTHPVAGNGAVDALAALQDFDGISYAKGASILRQLNTRLGDEVYLGGVVDHLRRHAFGNATMHDLFGAWERAGAGDLSAFTDAWLRTSGPDTISLDRASGVVRRTPPAGQDVARTHTLGLAVREAAGWTRRPLEISAVETPVDVGTGAVLLDPHEQTWALVLPDEATVEALVTELPVLADELQRAATWNQLRMAHDHGAIDPARVVDVAVAAPPVEDLEDTPVRAVPRRTVPWLVQTLLPLAPAGSRERVHAAAVARTAAEPAGSEHQHSALRLAIATATDPATLRGWLAAPPPGIDADLDLRWRVLVRLAVLGACDAAELDAALAADPTAQARVEHSRARASLPDAEAKAWAWARFTGETPVPNYDLEAAGTGLWQPGQEELTAPYVERYFAALDTVAEVHRGWVRGTAVEAFFPATALSQETLERARERLADESLDPTVRRRLADTTDLLARRLAVRTRYGA
ncbi:aminopeptidase N [Nocardioides sp. zg-DK7169]|uniref:aminopeptidase N n=1 Tax=Nocardioides sp. zg-DK7169 TaxID=2736600 RepID=UPI0015577981|nr:aminopeptidase N [Nocardioides sp. zg-DK7169]